MGTEKHSEASRKRWAKVPKAERTQRMISAAQSGWDKLDVKARRRRALKGVRTRRANRAKLENNNQQ